MADHRPSHAEPTDHGIGDSGWGAQGSVSRPDTWLPPESATPFSDPPVVGRTPDPVEEPPAADWSAYHEPLTSAVPGWPEFSAMTWSDFEQAMAEVFRQQGFAVTVTRDGADGGVDLILDRPGERILVQCKHWRAYKVGVREIRELYGVVTARGASGGILATSGRFTNEARAFAASTHIQLLGRAEVTALLDRTPAPRSASWSGAMPGTAVGGPEPLQGRPRCPRCGEWMLLRTTRRGQSRGEQFWGCPRFPTCRGLLPTVAAHIPAVAPSSAMGNPAWWGGRSPQGVAQQPGAHQLAKVHSRQRSSRVIAVVAPLVVSLLGFVLIVGVLPQLVLRPVTQGTVRNPVPSTRTTPDDPRIVAKVALDVPADQVAVDPDAKRAYVTSSEDRSITILDTTSHTVVSKVALARQPKGIAFDPDTQTLWVADYNDATVSVLDTSGTLQATIPVGRGPVGVAIDPNARKAYITNNLDKTVTVVNARTRKVTSTEKPGYAPGAAAVDPVKGHLCIVNATAMGLLYCYDTSLKFVGAWGPAGEAIAIDPVTHARYSTSAQAGVLKAKDGVSGTETSIPLGRKPTGVAVDPVARLAYVTDHDGKMVLVVRAA